MGITVSHLALASLNGSTVFDRQSRQEAFVKVIGRTPKSKRFPEGHPIYRLFYPSGFTCGLRWQDGQASPAYTLGVIPYFKEGKQGRPDQVCPPPSRCIKPDEVCIREEDFETA